MKSTFVKIPVALVFGVLLLMLSCATKKSKEDVSFMGKVYHNTTAKYNGYFNADEIRTAAYLQLEGSNKDNYTEVLRIFPWQGGDADKVKGELDRAIEKVSIVAASHEVSHWRDDCYLLVGEAQFMQKDYESAEETLEFFAQEFDPLKAKKRRKSKRAKVEDEESKKEKEKDRKQKMRERKKANRKNKKVSREERAKMKAEAEAEKAKAEAKAQAERIKEQSKEEETESYFMKHRPVYEDGLLWLARTYIENDKFSLAQGYLRRVDETKGLHKDVRAPLYAIMAHYQMDQGQTGKAALQLEKAYVWEDDKKKKARYAYIMGQLMEQEGDYAAAAEYFDRAIGHRPGYDMVFNASLRKAINANASGAISGAEFQKEMEKMLKDEKNIDYQDQIYSAMASVSFAGGNEKEGIELLKTALSKGDKKSVYKTEAYYQLAEYYFGEEVYVSAKAYYDSTLLAMSEQDLRRPKVELLANNLTEIAAQITNIALQDSLLMLSNLPMEELLARAEVLQEKTEEEAALAAVADDPEALGQVATPPGARSGKIGGASFFAFDNLLRDKGIRDFKRQWGDRPLEDDWRRSQKSFQAFAEDEEDDENEKEEISSADEELIKKFFSSVPKNDDERQLVLKEKENALFTLGKLYRDNMQNCTKSMETMEQLMAEFPATANRMDALFYLYLCSVQTDDALGKKKYGDIIVKDYPESLYAKSIVDPDFLKKQEEAKRQLERYYEETYALLTEGQFEQVQKRLDEVNQLFANTGNLTAKFSLITAMMAGQREGKQAYITALKDVIAKHKETPEATRAREIMRFLQGDKDAFKVTEDGQLVDSKFKIENDKLHYVFAVIYDFNDLEMTDVKVSISEYNRRFHKRDKLSLSTLDLDIENSTPLVLIRKFRNKDEAMDYFGGIQKRKEKFISTKVDYEVYAVSQYNYREVIKERSVNSYRSFFNEEYLVD